jgi:hypothetical protein
MSRVLRWFRRGRVAGVVVAAFAALAVPAAARGQAVPESSGAVQGVAPSQAGPARRLLEERIRQRFAQVVQTRLGLTDAQMAQLRATNQRFAGQRGALSVSERGVRQALQGELRPGAAANQEHVSALMDSLLAIQRQRLDLVQGEQRELAGYLTPVQRVRYYSLQQALHRRLEQLQQMAAAHPLLFNRKNAQQRGAAADSLEAAPF